MNTNKVYTDVRNLDERGAAMKIVAAAKGILGKGSIDSFTLTFTSPPFGEKAERLVKNDLNNLVASISFSYDDEKGEVTATITPKAN